MAERRQNPAAAQKARVGNYIADVDTAGIDASMKETMGIGKPPAKRLGFMDMLKSVIVRKPKPKPKPAPKY